MGKQPEPWASLARRLANLEDQIRRMTSASPFTDTGMHPNGEGGIDSDNFQAGASGYSFKADGNAEFNFVTFRGGIIGDDALTNPVKTQVARAEASGFSVAPSVLVEKVGVDVVVPAGFTEANVSVFGRLYMVNPNTTGGVDGFGTDAIYVSAGISTYGSTATPTGISGGNGFATSVTFDSFILTGLTPGDTLHVRGQAATSSQTLSTANSYINVVADISWYR